MSKKNETRKSHGMKADGYAKDQQAYNRRVGAPRKNGDFTVEHVFAGTATLESCIAEYLSRKYGIARE